MQRLLTAVVVIAALTVIFVATALAGNPSQTGTGQPTQSCQAEQMGPPGIFSKDNGFANTAVNVYAGTQPQNSNNPKSVSQYDVACYQFQTHHG